MFWKISKGIKEIGDDMKNNPQDWFQEEYYFCNSKNIDIQVWTCNGAFGCNLRGHEGLTWFEKRYLMDCVAQSKANRLRIN